MLVRARCELLLLAEHPENAVTRVPASDAVRRSPFDFLTGPPFWPPATVPSLPFRRCPWQFGSRLQTRTTMPASQPSARASPTAFPFCHATDLVILPATLQDPPSQAPHPHSRLGSRCRCRASSSEPTGWSNLLGIACHIRVGIYALQTSRAFVCCVCVCCSIRVNQEE